MQTRPRVAQPALRWACWLAALAVACIACDDDSPAGAEPDAADAAQDADGADAADADGLTDAATDLAPDPVEDAPPAPVLRVNELVAAPLGDEPDWIEIFNPGETPVDLLGWSLSDDDPTHQLTLATSQVVPAGGYWLLEQDAAGSFDFGLGDADAVLLYDGEGALADAVEWETGDAPAGMSFGRIPNGTGGFQTLVTPTPGAANVANPAAGCGNDAIDLDEVCDGDHFGPNTCLTLGMGTGELACLDDCTRLGADGCAGPAEGVVINEVTSGGTDRIELLNTGAASVDVTGWQFSDDDPAHVATLASQSIDAGAYLVLETDVDFDFGLGGNDAVFLRDAEGDSVDGVDWLDEAADVSYCRIPNGSGPFQACAPTFGSENEAP